MVKNGDQLFLPLKIQEKNTQDQFFACKVIYIHPEKRFCRVEFNSNNIKPIRLAFKLNENGDVMI